MIINPLCFALSIPILWALITLIDKYTISFRVKNTFSYITNI
ncbi:MAG: hypothetical protein ACP5OZ_04395 [Candidatus Woesearchaeota archaeon]